jgi:hypothetical protein
MTILAIAVQLIESSGIIRSKAMRMSEQGRPAAAPNIFIHLPSSTVHWHRGISPYSKFE